MIYDIKEIPAHLRKCFSPAPQIGLERSVEDYVSVMVGVFRDVYRVLRNDGTAWVNLGDVYATGAGQARIAGGKCFGKQNRTIANGAFPITQPNRLPQIGLKPKDLVGLPWRVAFALQADGWFLRSDIVWAKRNPMPESVTDRPTRCHEFVFLLTKSATYFYDMEAIKEPVAGTANNRGGGVNPKAKLPGPGSRVHIDRDVQHAAKASKQNRSFSAAVTSQVSTRNKRSVWTINSQPYKGSHFATFPEKLVEPCILAGTSQKGCCPECGAQWKRVLQKAVAPQADYNGKYAEENNRGRNLQRGIIAGRANGTGTNDNPFPEKKTVGWAQTCKCAEHTPVPCTVADFFGGSGTTAAVAIRHGRKAVLAELNPDYIKLILKRCTMPLFTKEAA